MNKQAPLMVWLTAICIFIFLEVLIYGHNNREARLERAVSNEIIQAENYIRGKGDSCKLVVAIGSSLTGNALWGGSDFARNSTEKFGKDIYMLAVTAPVDPAEMFLKDLRLVDRVLPLKPDLFMIQMELAAVKLEPVDVSSFPNYTPFLIELSSANLNFFKVISLQQKIAHKLSIPEKDLPHTAGDTLAPVIIKRELKKEEHYFTQALIQLREAGVPVLIYDVPKPYANEKVIYSGLFKKQLDSVLNSFNTAYNTDYLYYKGPRMYYRLFSDGGHMNTSGSNVYTDWLTGELISRLY